MGLRDWIKKIIYRGFKNKQLNAANINSDITLEQPIFHSTLDELKVDGIGEKPEFNLKKIEEEYENCLKEISQKYKNAILSDETLNKIKNDEIRTGTIGETPFICTLEENGGITTTVIITDKSCAKIKEENGEAIYQETRVGDNNEMKTILNTENTSLVIKGNVTQNEIDSINNFSKGNKDTIAKIRDFGNSKDNDDYKNLLEKLGVNTEIDLNDRKNYMTSFSGRVKRGIDGNIRKLEQISLVLDKSNPEKDPLIISLNTLQSGKNIERKFYLTKNGKYIDESSVRNEDGNMRFAELTLNDIKELAGNKELDTNFIDKSKKINRENVRLIPKVAEKLHEETKRGALNIEKTENKKDNSDAEKDESRKTERD